MPRKAFGGMTISFRGRKETAEEVFGARPITPAEMTKRLWAFVRGRGLMAPRPAAPLAAPEASQAS